MTYIEWKELHAKAKSNIISKHNLNNVKDIIKYFDYDNMVVNESNFCPLYKDNIKCHNIDNLNCYYCGCPYFIINENPKTVGKTTIVSTCMINSKYKSEYYENPDGNNVVRIHCDCSNCYVPHTTKFATKYLTECVDNNTNLSDHNSILEYVRNKQKIIDV